jgi:hypothetical protein
MVRSTHALLEREFRSLTCNEKFLVRKLAYERSEKSIKRGFWYRWLRGKSYPNGNNTLLLIRIIQEVKSMPETYQEAESNVDENGKDYLAREMLEFAQELFDDYRELSDFHHDAAKRNAELIEENIALMQENIDLKKVICWLGDVNLRTPVPPMPSGTSLRDADQFHLDLRRQATPAPELL